MTKKQTTFVAKSRSEEEGQQQVCHNKSVHCHSRLCHMRLWTTNAAKEEISLKCSTAVLVRTRKFKTTRNQGMKVI